MSTLPADSVATSSSASGAPTEAAAVRSQAIRANAAWMLMGNSAFAVARALIVVIIAKCGTQAMVGQYVWAVAICLPTITICRWGVRILLATDATDELRFGDYMGFTLISSVVGLAIVAGVILLWPPTTLELVQAPTPAILPQWVVVAWPGPENVPDVYLIGLVLIVAVWNSLESVSDVFSALFQRYERMDYIAKSLILQATLMCLLMAVALFVQRDVRWGAMGLALAALVRLLFYEIPVGRRLVAEGSELHPIAIGQATASIRPQFDRSAITRLLKLGAPLAIVMYIMVLTTSVPRYILRDSLGDARLGVFGALFALASAPNLLISSVSQSLSTRLAVLHVERQRARFIRLILRALMLSLAVSGLGLIIALLAGKLVLTLVYKPDYAADNNVFQILMLVGVVEGIGYVVGTAASSMRRFHVQVPIHLLKLVTTYVGLLLVVGSFGLTGVAWVLVAASLLMVLCYSAVSWWELRAV